LTLSQITAEYGLERSNQFMGQFQNPQEIKEDRRDDKRDDKQDRRDDKRDDMQDRRDDKR
jgi:hypothetical protein